MIYHTNAKQTKIFAEISVGKGKKRQLIGIQLNEYDNDPGHFWISFVTALSGWDIQFSLSERQKNFPGSEQASEVFMDMLIQAVRKNPLMLVMENFDRIANNEVKQFILTLLERDELPVILLYNEQKLLAVKNEFKMEEGEARHIYIPVEEERRYYEKRGLQLTEEQFNKARRFTDGWGSAVEALEVLVKKHGPVFFQQMEFYVNDWLETEIFPRYTQPELHRLVCLSMLDEFSIPLVQHLHKWSGESLIDVMEASPIIRYCGEKQAYCYGAYVLRLIKERQVLLKNKDKEKFLIKVADWYRECGNGIEAIKYYRKAGANQKILQVINQWNFPASREQAACYVDTISNLPEHFLDKYPLLHIVRAHMLSTLYRYRDAYLVLEAFCEAHDRGEETAPEIQSVLGEAYMHWANTCTALLVEESVQLKLYQRAAELLPNGSSMMRSKVNLFSDCPMIRLPRPTPGAFQESLDCICKIEPYLIILTNGAWAGSADLARAEMNFYIRNFKEVEGSARKAIVTALEHEQYDMACSAYFLLIRFYFAKGNYEKTMEHLAMLKQLASEARYETFFSMPDLAESWLQLKLGKRHSVADWIKDENYSQKKILPWNYGRDRLVRAYYLLLDQQFEALLAYADSSIRIFRKRGYHLLSLQMWMMKAVAYYELEEWDKANEVFEFIYTWCHGNNVVMPIVEFGSFVRPLVECYQKSGGDVIPEDWLLEIEKKANSYYVYQYNIRKQYERKQRIKSSLLETLTGAEQKLLLLITRGMTSKEIAETQGKSISAVKGMARRLYTKIGASGMADAVRIAKENHIEEIVSL